MIQTYYGKGHRGRASNHKGCFFISKSLSGPLHVWENIQAYKEHAFCPGKTDFEMIPANKQVCVYMDLDINGTDDEDDKVFDIIDIVCEKIKSKVRWVGTSHKQNKKSYHVIFNGTMTVEQQKHFFKEMKENWMGVYSKQWIDTSVYSDNQLFRSFQQNKKNENRPIVDHPKFAQVSFCDRFVTYTKNANPVPYTIPKVNYSKPTSSKKAIDVDHTLMTLLRQTKRKKQWELFLDNVYRMIQHDKSIQVLSTFCISKAEVCDHSASVFINYTKIISHCHGAKCNAENPRFVMDTPQKIKEYITSNDKSVDECLRTPPRELPEGETPFFEGFTVHCKSRYHPAFEFGKQSVCKIEREKNEACVSISSTTLVTNFGMGAGKTFASKEHIQKHTYDRILVISCRILQTVDFIKGATGMDFKSYKEFDNYYNMSNCPRLVIQVDSLYKLKNLDYSLFVYVSFPFWINRDNIIF